MAKHPPYIQRARVLRQSGNSAENRLWHYVRNRQLSGLKFVRQWPIGPYFADFACRERRLVVEIDGSQHMNSVYDDRRDRFMCDQGWSVARFWYADVLNRMDTVLDTLVAVVDGRINDTVRSREFRFLMTEIGPSLNDSGPSPQPSPQRGEGESKMKTTSPQRGEGEYMQRALKLAYEQLGRTSPNPAVGCVIVRDDRIIAEAATGDGGRPHAEETALQKLGGKAHGATAYVTLEPCGERSNGGCSCSQLLVQAGVHRVVFACEDPSPYASHIGTRRLEAAGIAVETGLLHAEAFGLIHGFVHYLNTGRPLVSESATGEGFDARYERAPLTDAAEDLKIWGGRGFRRLWVESGSELAQHLAQQGLLHRVTVSG